MSPRLMTPHIKLKVTREPLSTCRVMGAQLERLGERLGEL